MEGLTEFAASSYATDTALLAELRATLPPSPGPGAAAAGYRPTDLATLDVVGAVRLTDRLAVALATDAAADDGSFAVLPVVADGGRWRAAAAGDGLSAFVAGVPLASERPIDVDQTNASVVVGERTIVKWFRRVGPGPSRAQTLVAHLDAVGFAGIPAPLGSLIWRSPAGVELTLAQGDGFLPAATDGWDWCVESVERELDPSIGTRIGRLTADLHAALRTPSPVIEQPIEQADAEGIAARRHAAVDVLESALSLTDGEAGIELRGFAPAMRRALDSLPTDGPIQVQPIHGDFHVGQILEWSGGLAVIDFDGNPMLGSEGNAIRQRVERDVAQMLVSLDLVGRVVKRRVNNERHAAVDRWIAEARALFLRAIEPVDGRLLPAFEIEQLCRRARLRGALPATLALRADDRASGPLRALTGRNVLNQVRRRRDDDPDSRAVAEG